jgi:hypothetical protein
MELTGSRTSGNDDFFSDWDFVVDSADDFGQIYRLLKRALVWRLHVQGDQNVLTVIGPKGEIFKFVGLKNQLLADWGKVESLIADADLQHPELHDYWIQAFQFLKTLHRNYGLLSEVGIEHLTGQLRDIYLQHVIDVVDYKSTYSYRIVKDHLAESSASLSNITGLPYRTTAERLTKIRQMNQLIDSVSPNGFNVVSKVFEGKVHRLDQPASPMLQAVE